MYSFGLKRREKWSLYEEEKNGIEKKEACFDKKREIIVGISKKIPNFASEICGKPQKIVVNYAFPEKEVS